MRRLLLCSVFFFSWPAIASAATHRPNYTPRVTNVSIANPSFHGTVNSMMYTVTATVDDTYDNARHEAVVGLTTTGPPSGSRPSVCPTGATYAWSQPEVFGGPEVSKTWTLYNFQPGTRYYYTVRTGASGSYKYRCGALQTAAAPTPTLPASLADLDLRVDNSSGTYFTRYVLFDSDGCEDDNYLIALDADSGAIVWYLDVAAVSGIPGAKIGGWRYQERGDAYVASDRLLVTLGDDQHRQYVLAVEMDGATLRTMDFGALPSGEDGHLCDGTSLSIGPCPHHDVFESDLTGITYVLVSGDSGVGIAGNPTWTSDICTNPPYRFIGDGYVALDDAYSIAFTHYLISDLGYDPVLEPGPNAPSMCAVSTGWGTTLNPMFHWIDWTHVNSVAGTADGLFVDLSLKQWDQIVRVAADGSGDRPVWTLSGDPTYSDFGPIGSDLAAGTPSFASQHDVHTVAPDNLLLFDNKGNPGPVPGTAASRVLSVRFTTGAGPSARLDKSWALVDNDEAVTPLDCPTKGSGQFVPGDGSRNSVLALCHAAFTIEELHDPTGRETRPSLHVSLPAEPAPVCSGSTTTTASISGWYRAYPLDHIGDF